MRSAAHPQATTATAGTAFVCHAWRPLAEPRGGNPSGSRRTRITLADGSFWAYTYDALGQVTGGKRSWSDGTPVAGQQFEYGFDDIGNRTSSKAGGDQNGLNLRSATWSNDAENQLTSRTVPGYFEVVGQANPGATVTVNTLSTYRRGEYFRKEITAANGSAPVYGANTVSAQWGTTNDTASGSQFVAQTPESFLYDPDGNLLRDGRWDYAWDAENRLIKMTTRTDVTVAPVRRLEFEYDWQGRRIGKKVYDARTGGTLLSEARYLYDGWNLLVELNGSNAKVRGFLWGTDLSGSLQGAGGVGGLLKVTYYGTTTTHCFVGYDGNGNVTLLADAATGAVLAQYEYGPFGETIRITGPSTGSMAKANPFRFSTKYQDDETDLLYYGYRYYSPGWGRWLSRDPIEEEGFLNLYAANRNDTVSRLDALGLQDDFIISIPYSWYSEYVLGTIDALVRTTTQFGYTVVNLTEGALRNRDFFRDWLLNHGDPVRIYGPQDPLTKFMRNSSGVAWVRAEYRKRGCPSWYETSYPTIRSYKNVFFHWGWLNPVEFQVGGFDCQVVREGSTVFYTVENIASWRSLIGEPTLRAWVRRARGYVGFRGEPWSPWPRHTRDEVRYGGAIYQKFMWYEYDPCCK